MEGLGLRNNCPSWRINWKRKRNMETGAKWGTCGIIDKKWPSNGEANGQEHGTLNGTMCSFEALDWACMFLSKRGT